jgi:hypothetical protein
MILLEGDILLFNTVGNWWQKPFLKWAIGCYSHAAIYAGDGQIIEAIGRGVIVSNLVENYGDRRMIALRLNVASNSSIQAVSEAKKIASSQSSWYDFYGIVRYIIPMLLLRKITGKRYDLGYCRDDKFWCSEMVQEVYHRSGVELFDDPDFFALPGDFLKSPYLEEVRE